MSLLSVSICRLERSIEKIQRQFRGRFFPVIFSKWLRNIKQSHSKKIQFTQNFFQNHQKKKFPSKRKMSTEVDLAADGSEDNHPAVLALKQLLESDQITPETFNNLIFKFKKLHQAFAQSCSTEQILLRRTRDLNKELKSQKLTIQDSASQQQEHRTALTALRQYVTNIQTELDATREQIDTTKANTAMKKKEAAKLADKVAKARDDQILKLEPQKKQIQVEISALEDSIGDKRKTIDNLKTTAKNITEKMSQCDSQLTNIEKKKRAADQKMLEISSIPIKTRQKSSAVESSHNTMLSEEKSLTQQLGTAESTLLQLHTQAHDFETEYQHITNDIEGMSQAITDVKMKSEELRQKCSEYTNNKQQREYDSRRIVKLVGEQNKEIANLNTKLENLGKDIAKKEKESQRLEETMARLAIDTATLSSQLTTLTSDQQKEESHNRQLFTTLNKQMEAKEAALKAILAVEEVNQRILDDIKAALIDKDRKQSVHDQLSKKEHELQLELTEASLIRDRKAREMASMKKKTIDSKTLAMERNLDYMDLCRKQEQNAIKLRECSEMYEKVKLDRNKNVNHIQTSRQLIVEYKEKIRILENEVEVLRAEFEQVDAAVKLQKNDLMQAFKRRDATKSDLKRAELGYKDLQGKIDFQMNETSRLNLVLQNLENSIQHHQDLYMKQSDDCANIQRELIDRQDQLCLVNEQFNRHEEVMKRGEIALKDREEEYKLLNLQLKDFQRQIDIIQRKVPQLRAYEAEIVDLQKQLNVERKDVDKITQKLEAPDLKERQRAYCGKDFTLKELEEKVSLYEQRINSKEQQLWEKQILLREIEDKINELMQDSRTDNKKTSKIYEKSGSLRAEAMALRRKKMAAMAESSVYKTQSDELQEQKESIRKELQTAGERTQRGEAFDEYAEKMITMHIRDKMSATLPHRGDEYLELDDEEERRPGRQHFDAYPTADGLSRPYGAFPVFQPGAPSGQLRHYRNETQRPIEL
ncbi:hypothetical protein TRFO_14702 [Tritrichomonas foetus]|uniref:Uncharacterized protein n=1 Tax=Tritrichomonas foetus TaxID=1144522 RepID=A0A1J4KUG1_9EUKA|nr:hypothetical protein TRFO_14702 [Tritrichomonas foetus]|eukprot:OHT14907.1 hypothetical protein TRFO_14702 [Tritrichomonas foetus]